MKHSVNVGEMRWDSREMRRPNIFPGDIMRLGAKLVLVVHSSESSAKVIPVSETDINDDECIFSAAERGEVVSSFICYNEPGGGCKMVGRLPSNRLKVRESVAMTSAIPAEPQRVFKPARPSRPVSPAMIPVMSVIHDDIDDSLLDLVNAARHAANSITSSGLAS